MKLGLSQISVAAMCCLLLSCSEHIIDIPQETENESSGNKGLRDGSKATLHDFIVDDQNPNNPPDDMTENPYPGTGMPRYVDTFHLEGNETKGIVYGTLVHDNRYPFSFSFEYSKKPDGKYDITKIVVKEPTHIYNGPKTVTITKTVAQITSIPNTISITLIGSLNFHRKDYTNPADQKDDQEDYDYYSGDTSVGSEYKESVPFSLRRVFDLKNKIAYE